MKPGFDRLTEYDRVKRNGHDHRCAIEIVTKAAPCSCGCVPTWVVSEKTLQRWRYQTRRQRAKA